MQISRWLFIILAGLFLIACSDSDSDSNSSSPSPPPPVEPEPNPEPNPETVVEQTISITSANSVAVSNTAIKRLFDTSNANYTLFDMATDAEEVLILVNVSFPCEESGTFDSTLVDNDSSGTFSVGDTLNITEQDCRFKDGITTDGQSSLTLLEEEPNLSIYYVFNNSTIIDSGESFLSEGDLNIIINDNSESISSSNTLNFSEPNLTSIISNVSLTNTVSDILESFIMTADSLTIVEDEVEKVLSHLSFTLTKDNNTLLSTLELTGTLSDPTLGGTLSIDTLQPFKILENDEFPYAGMVKITAPDNSNVTLTVLDAVNVRLEMDENGDGAINDTFDRNWTSLSE